MLVTAESGPGTAPGFPPRVEESGVLGVNRKLQWKGFGQAHFRQPWDATIAGGGFTHCTVMAAPPPRALA